MFEKDYDTKRIILELELFLGKSIKPGTTLIILDEIQECGRALTAMKYFCENAPEYLRVVNGRAIVTPIDQSRTDNSVVTINVYAQPGQSAQQIAQEVKRLFMREQEGRLAAYA